jgi:hypothetical protein
VKRHHHLWFFSRRHALLFGIINVFAVVVVRAGAVHSSQTA